jgi:UDPglucose 6-dehydrogenase
MTQPAATVLPSAVSVVGLGKLGLPLAACLSASGFRTIGVDVIARNVAEINAGRSPIVEPGLAELVQAHGGSALRATTNIREAIAETAVTFVIVPTPSDESGGFSNALLREAIDQIGVALSDNPRREHLVVVSSTVMPGSIGRDLGPLLAAGSGRPLGDGVDICYDPDFISLGEVVRGLREPELVLIGEHRAASGDTVEAIHRRMAVNRPHVARMPVVSAEITKLALNAYVTMKISFANNLADICSGIAGADVDAVTAALGADSRISPRYLSAGLSFGGTCFPRDTVAFRRLAACAGTTAPLMEATEQINREHARRLSALVRECQKPSGGTVAVLGLAFRHETPVTTVSPSIALVRDLLDAGISVIGCDPMAADSARQELGDSIEYASTPAGALARSTVAVLTHRSRHFAEAIESFEPAAPLTIVDCWRMIDPARVRPGVSIVPFGRWIS